MSDPARCGHRHVELQGRARPAGRHDRGDGPASAPALAAAPRLGGARRRDRLVGRLRRDRPGAHGRHGRLGGPGGGGRGQRHRPRRPPRGWRGRVAAPGDPLRHRHPRHARGGRDDGAIRRGRDPCSRRNAPDLAGRGPEARLDPPERARRVGPDATLTHGALARDRAPHRRVRPGPPLGQPVRPAL